MTPFAGFSVVDVRKLRRATLTGCVAHLSSHSCRVFLQAWLREISERVSLRKFCIQASPRKLFVQVSLRKFSAQMSRLKFVYASARCKWANSLCKFPLAIVSRKLSMQVSLHELSAHLSSCKLLRASFCMRRSQRRGFEFERRNQLHVAQRVACANQQVANCARRPRRSVARTNQQTTKSLIVAH